MITNHALRIRPKRLAVALFLAALVVALPVWATADGQPHPSTPTRLEIVSLASVTSEHENVKPFLVARPQGGVYLAWAEKIGERTAVLLARSADGEKFDQPVRLSAEGMDLDLGAENGPNVAVGPAGEIYVVWAAGSWAASKPTPPAGQTTTKPKSAAPATSHAAHGSKGGAPRRPGNLNIWLAKSTDDGRTFSQPVKVNDDRDGPEHRFPTVATDKGGNLFVAWLDKRKTTTERPNFCRVFVAMSRDGGQTFSRAVDATDGQPNSICHCCRIALAASSRGVFAAFRNDIEDLRDIFLVHSSSSLATFSKPAAMEESGWYVPT